MAKPTTITEQIEHNWEEVRNSPQLSEAVRKLPRETFAEDAPQSRECLMTYFNFESYKKCLQRLKAQQSALHPETEAMFVERLQQAVKAYRSFVSSADKVAASFRMSGVEEVLSNNARKLCWQLPHSKYFPKITETLRATGMNDSDISHYATILKDKDWDLLHLQGAQGTMTSVVKVASEQVPTLEKMVSVVRQHGLPVLEGSGGSAAPAAIGAVYFIGILAICIAVGPCDLLF